jgi:hypothetical protein
MYGKRVKMQFLVSESKSTKSSNPAPAPVNIRSFAADYQVQSTNVSSPVALGHDVYEMDGFIVPDDEFDSLGMPPVRAGPPRRTAPSRSRPVRHASPPPGLGAPINIASLTPYEQDILERFMGEAKKLRERIMTREGYNRIQSVFVDSTLQKLGLQLPKDQLTMAGIVKDNTKVDQFGHDFLTLCRKYAKEKAENFEDAEVPSQAVSNSQMPIEIDDDSDEDYDDGTDDGDFVEETSEYFQQTSRTAANGLSRVQAEALSQWNAAGGASQMSATRGRGTTTRGRARARGGTKTTRRFNANATSKSTSTTKKASGDRGMSGNGRGRGRGGGDSSAIRPMW